MPLLNLFQLLPGDDQQTHTDKINFNFDQILSMGGGPMGLQGIQGVQGVPGLQGLQGPQGDQGDPGARWTVDTNPPTGPFSPAPNTGDFWFDTSTLTIYEYDGSGWNSIGTLVVSSVFKQGTNNILFSNPQSNRSLVLSQLDYLDPLNLNSPDSDGSNAYRLKVIGESGLSLIQLGIVDPTISTVNEIPEADQARIFMDTDNSNPGTYKLTIENSSNDIFLSGAGSSLRIQRAVGNVSTFAYNATGLQLSINNTHRALTFASSTSSGINFHIGLHAPFAQPAISTSATGVTGRLFTVTASGLIGLNQDAPVYRYDQLARTSLGTITSNNIKLWRIQGNSLTSTPGTLDELKVDFIRSVTGNTYLGSEIRIGRGLNVGVGTSSAHYISFHGGAKTSTDEQLTYTAGGSRPMLRMGYGSASNSGYFFGADVNGYSIFGDSTTVKNYNEDTNTYAPDRARQLPTRLNIKSDGNTLIHGPNKSSYGGLHFLSNGASSGYAGITYGGAVTAANATNPLNELNTNAGLIFESETLTGGVILNLMNGKYADGMSKRMSIYSTGVIHLWGNTNKRHWIEIDVNDSFSRIDSGNWAPFQGRNIIFNQYTTTEADMNAATGSTNGVIAVAQISPASGPGIVSSISVISSGVFGSVPTVELLGGGAGSSFTQAVAVPIMSGGTSGTITGFTIIDPGANYEVPPVVVITGGNPADVVSDLRSPETGFIGGGFIGIGDFTQTTQHSAYIKGQPQTKFHVNGATTFGQRSIFYDYNASVGVNSFVHGFNASASGSYSAVIGGGGYNINRGDYSVMLGYNGNGSIGTAGQIVINDPYKVLMATHTGICAGGTPTFASTNAALPSSNGAITGASYLNPNSLTINLNTGNTNGLEVVTDAVGSNGSIALLLCTQKNSSAVDPVLFVVNKDGSTGIRRNIIPSYIPSAAPVSTSTTVFPWVFSSGAPALSVQGDIYIAGTGFQQVLKLANYRYQVSSAIGSNFIIAPGQIYNEGNGGTSASDSAAGDLILSGGDAIVTNGGNSYGGNIIIHGGNATGGNATKGNIIMAHNGSSPQGNVIIGASTGTDARFEVYGETSIISDVSTPSFNVEYYATTDTVVTAIIISNPNQAVADGIYQIDTHVYTTSGQTLNINTLRARTVARVLASTNYEHGGTTTTHVRRGEYFKITVFSTINGSGAGVGVQDVNYKLFTQTIGK